MYFVANKNCLTDTLIVSNIRLSIISSQYFDSQWLVYSLPNALLYKSCHCCSNINRIWAQVAFSFSINWVFYKFLMKERMLKMQILLVVCGYTQFFAERVNMSRKYVWSSWLLCIRESCPIQCSETFVKFLLTALYDSIARGYVQVHFILFAG